ncbi:MAG TPA: hypothetical protein VGF45_11850, partial [Polyangia bacterium]
MFGACGPSDPKDRIYHLGPIEGTFAVSDFFTPSGHMGDGQNLGFLHADAQLRCKPRPEGAAGYCYNFTYLKRGEFKWAGVYWVYPANNWGSREGIRIKNSSSFKQVRFKAAASVPVRLQFFYGGITGASGALPYMDQIRGFGAEDITEDWKQIHMEILHDENMPLTNLIGAFGWAIRYPDGEMQSEPHFPDGDKPFNIFIDDIVWDTDPPPAPKQVTTGTAVDPSRLERETTSLPGWPLTNRR